MSDDLIPAPHSSITPEDWQQTPASVRDGILSYADFMTEFLAVQARIHSWLIVGLDATSSRTVATCRQRLDGEASLWHFVTSLGVAPPTTVLSVRCATASSGGVPRMARHPIRAASSWSAFSRWSRPVASSSALCSISSARR